MTPRRDPRRLFTSAQRNQIAARQHHTCRVCQADLPDIFHVHHVVPWSEGGSTVVDNGVAVCPNCHLVAEVRTPDTFTPRVWQEEALPEVLPKLRSREFATVNAAPGAGKTLFTGWVYSNIAATGDVARLVVFAGTTTHLQTQWADELRRFGLYVDIDTTTERPERDGVVLTYHALADAAKVQQIIADADAAPTLFVLDEVHHLAIDRGGEAGTWALNIARIVGSIDRPSHPVLNLSGTLFRSKRSERIATIQYTPIGDQIETRADYSITAGRLIAEEQLRHIVMLGYDADMTVTPVNVAESAHSGAASIRAVDLNENTHLRSPVLAELIRNEQFVKGIIIATVDRLAHASTALESAPVKGLMIADNVEHAQQVYSELVATIGPRRAFIAHSNIANVGAEIARFRASTGQAIMVAVQMVTEGFDVPDICVLTYLRTWKASLFINQMAGRAMRITARERELGMILPATIIVPNEFEIKAAFADVLVGAMRVLDAPPKPCRSCGREICACPPRPRNKECSRCGMPFMICTCTCNECGLSKYRGCTCDGRWGNRLPLVNVDVLTDPELAYANVDGHDVKIHVLEGVRDFIRASGAPDIYIEQIANGVQKAMEADPMTFLSYLQGENR